MLNEQKTYYKIFKNAEELINSANSISKIGNYGTAISLLILSLEELIKFQVVLYNQSERKPFNQTELRKVFFDHKTKHKILIEYQEVFSEEFTVDFVKYVLKSVFKLDFDDDDFKTKENRFKEMGVFLKFVYKDLNLTRGERLEFQQWLRDANGLKNEGLYVNLIKEKWQSPQDKTKIEYHRALKFVTSVYEQTKVIKELDLSDSSIFKLIGS